MVASKILLGNLNCLPRCRTYWDLGVCRLMSFARLGSIFAREGVCARVRVVYTAEIVEKHPPPLPIFLFFFLLLFFRFRLGMHTHLDRTRDHLLFCQVFVSVLFLGHLDVGSSIARFGQGERLL